MRRNTVFALALALALAALAPAAFAGDAPQVEVKPLSGGRFELTATVPNTTDPRKGQAALLPKAIELCGTAAPQLGRYEFKSTAPMAGTGSTISTSLVFAQELQCGDATPVNTVVSEVGRAPTTPPSANDEADIRSRTLKLMSAKDRGDFDAAVAMFSGTTGAMLTEEAWRSKRRAFNASAGMPQQQQVMRVTWYDDPIGAAPGRYAAADYSASHENAAFYCGYVVWLRQPDGGYRIVREEEGQMNPAEARLIAPSDMAAARAQLGCRD